MTHTGLPIMASLANTAVSFSCRITYPYTPQFKVFTVSYFHEDLQGQRSPKKPTNCHPGLGTENQSHTLDCQVTLVLPGASATGTYYCSVHWPHSTVRDSGTFILVRGKASSVALPGQRTQRFQMAVWDFGSEIENGARRGGSHIPALWEAEAGGSPEVRDSRPAWPTW